MVALVCVGLWLMVGRVDSSAGTATVAVAWLARLAIFVFFIYYTALDAIGGFGLARTILITKSQHLPPDQLRSVIGVIDATWTDPWVGGVGSFVSETGSWAAFAAAVLTAGPCGSGPRSPGRRCSSSWPSAGSCRTVTRCRMDRWRSHCWSSQRCGNGWRFVLLRHRAAPSQHRLEAR